MPYNFDITVYCYVCGSQLEIVEYYETSYYDMATGNFILKVMPCEECKIENNDDE